MRCRLQAERKQEVIKEFATIKNDTGSPEVQVAVSHRAHC